MIYLNRVINKNVKGEHFMYCKKCGKFIGTDADLCDECKQKESARSENQYYQATNLYKNTGFYQSQTILRYIC